MTLNLHHSTIPRIINDLKEEIKNPVYVDRLRHPTFLSFLSATTGLMRIDEDACDRFRKVEVLYRNLRTSRAEPLHYEDKIQSQPVKKKFTTQLSDFQSHKLMVETLAANGHMDILPNYASLMLVDQVWVDWVSEAVARAFGFHILKQYENGSLPENRMDFKDKLMDAFGTSSKEHKLEYRTVKESVKESLVDMFIKNMGIDPKTERLTGTAPTVHEAGVIRDVRATYELYIHSHPTYASRNVRFANNVAQAKPSRRVTEINESELLVKRMELRKKSGIKTSVAANDMRHLGLFVSNPAKKSVVLRENPEHVAYCPTPKKKVHHSVTSAAKYISERLPSETNLRPYHCPCGSIHIGHGILDENGVRVTASKA